MDILDTLSESFETSMKRWGVPGLSVAILDGGDIAARSFGVVDIDTMVPVTPETIFGIGSISKVFTATLAVKLADLGRVDLDRPINELLPLDRIPVSMAHEPVTLRHLLTHTSGLSADGFADHGNDVGALSRYIDSLRDIDMIFSPGMTWSYANTGTCIAGFVLATLAGVSFEDLLREEVLKPLGLERTGFGQSPMPENVATGYDHGPGEAPKPRPYGTTWRSANPAGGMASTVGDLLRFAAFHLGDGTVEGDRVMSQEQLTSMQSTQATLTSVDAWGIGWAKRIVGGRTLIEHGGWMDGYRAQLTLLPDAGVAIAVLNNGGYGHTANDEVRDEILASRYDVVKEDPAAIQVPDSVLASYAGRYRSSHIDVTFKPFKGRLSAQYQTAWHLNDGNEMMLDPVTSTEFIITNGEFKGDRVMFLPHLNQRGMALRFLSRVLFRDPEGSHG